MTRNAARPRSLLVGAANDQSDPIESTAKFLLRASAHVDVREQVLMTYLVYFAKPEGAQRARSIAAQAGWRATLFAVPEAYVLRLTRRRMLTDGRVTPERDEVLQIASAYDGNWRYVLLEQGVEPAAWEWLAQEVGNQAAESATVSRVPSQRSPTTGETSATKAPGAAG